MGYKEDLQSSTNLSELFNVWKNKPACNVEYIKKKSKIQLTIDHGNNYFIADGIVDYSTWNNSGNKKILFILKEAYGKDWGDYTLASWLGDENGEKMSHAMWRRVARWVYGISNTSESNIAKYIPELTKQQHFSALRSIAVLNLKKSDGQSGSDYEEINAYAENDRDEIKKELSLIDADIIVCGSTFKTLYETVYEHKDGLGENANDNWFYYLNLDGKERLYIDYYHPANQWPDLINYYAITNIYQQALLSR
ncbi:MAG: hypothetical protein K6B41_03895 [Butyrivibrio sp.]|nr:hypothetical protein [Butyrivibrio sp.]